MIDSLAGIIPPHNGEIEAALLAAIMHDNGAYDRVSGIVEPDHFYEPFFGRVFEVAGKIITAGEYANAARLVNFFADDPALAKVGGGDYLYSLQDSVITIGAAVDYARDIREMWKRRKLVDVGLSIVENATTFEVGEPVDSDIADAEQRLVEINGTNRIVAPVRASDAAWSTLQEIDAAVKARERGEVIGIPTGIAPLDEKIGGLHRSALYVVAGATSQGKSALAGTICDNVAAAGFSCLFVSLEMPESQLMRRTYSRLTGIPVPAMDRADLTTANLKSLAEAGITIGKWPLYTLDKGDLSLAELRGHVRRLKKAHGLDLIVVDYLQLLMPPAGTRYEGRVQEVAKLSRGLKSLAMDVQVPVVALSQLSRAVDQRDDRTPRLSDLRESGSIEQDADVVIFVYREEKYLREKKLPPGADDIEKAEHQAAISAAAGKAELIVAKQRQGATGSVEVGFDGGRMLFKSEPSFDYRDKEFQRWEGRI